MLHGRVIHLRGYAVVLELSQSKISGMQAEHEPHL